MTDIAAIKELVNKQAEDEGLWFHAQTCAEAYVQQELRKLHAVIEGTDDFGFPKPSVSDTGKVDG